MSVPTDRQTAGHLRALKFRAPHAQRKAPNTGERLSQLLRYRIVPAFLLIALAAALGALPAGAQARPSKSLTVERIYGAPSLSGRLVQGIQWSPDGERISYLEHDGSRVEMWTMDATKGERKILVNANVLHEVLAPGPTSTIQATGLGRVQADKYT